MTALLEMVLYIGFIGFVGFLAFILVLWSFGLIEIQI